MTSPPNFRSRPIWLAMVFSWIIGKLGNHAAWQSDPELTRNASVKRLIPDSLEILTRSLSGEPKSSALMKRYGAYRRFCGLTFFANALAEATVPNVKKRTVSRDRMGLTIRIARLMLDPRLSRPHCAKRERFKTRRTKLSHSRYGVAECDKVPPTKSADANRAAPGNPAS